MQDAWTVNQRADAQSRLARRARGRAVVSARTIRASHFGFGDKIAPRVGFAWDVKGDSRWKAYGSWGMFYDLMKLTIGRVMFGGDTG